MVYQKKYIESTDPTSGAAMMALAERLYPICRSITGEGVRQTLRIIQEHIPLELKEIESGTKVFDWTVPKEWNIEEAWVKDPAGNTIIDFREHNLHLLNYSIPIHQQVNLQTLKEHLYTLPGQPDLIPYRTSYYQENWGFCMSHNQYTQLGEGSYEVCIKSKLTDGVLNYGELFLPGKSKKEVLLSTHICHPSLANDNLSGIAILCWLAKELQRQSNEYSYRFLFIPGTIGAISWLALNQATVPDIKHGLVAALLGGPGDFTYKRSRQGDAEIDEIAAYVLAKEGYAHQIVAFNPYGYDERQFCSPGFNLAVGNLGRTPYGQFPEYHTSADNMDFIHADQLQESLELYCKIVGVLERNQTFKNLQPYCEPQLGRRGLYNAIGGDNDSKELQLAVLWILNLSDGNHSLLDIARRSNISFDVLDRAARLLLEHELLSICC